MIVKEIEPTKPEVAAYLKVGALRLVFIFVHSVLAMSEDLD